MDASTGQNRRPSLRFNEDEIKFSLSVMDKMEKPIELMYFIMQSKQENPFVIIFISAYDVAIEKILQEQKRNTDLLFEIDKENNIYALICQETKVDGAYRFAERLLSTLIDNNAKGIYCTETEVRSTRIPIREVIFKSIEGYINAKKEKKENEIIFRSL